MFSVFVVSVFAFSVYRLDPWLLLVTTHCDPTQLLYPARLKFPRSFEPINDAGPAIDRGIIKTIKNEDVPVPAFFLLIIRIVRGLRSAWGTKDFRAILIIATLIVASGTVFYATVEGWRILDALYFSVMTLTTIGYGDIHPVTDFGKVFTILYAVAGIGIFVALMTEIARAHFDQHEPD